MTANGDGTPLPLRLISNADAPSSSFLARRPEASGSDLRSLIDGRFCKLAPESSVGDARRLM